MDVKNLVMAVVGMVLATIMIGGTLLPAVSSALDDERTIVNNNVYSSNYSIVEDPLPDDTNITIIYEMGADYATVNGDAVPIGTYNSYLFISSDCYIQIGLSGTNPNRYAGVGDTSIHNIPASATTINVNIIGNTLSFNIDGDVPVERTYNGIDWLAYASNDGTHKLKSKDSGSGAQNVTVNDMGQIYGATVITTNNIGFASFNGDTLIAQGTDSYKMVIDSIETPYVDAIVFKNGSGYHIDTSLLVNSGGSPVVPYYYLIPNKVVVHTEQQAITTALFGAIPIIAIAGLVMAGLYVFISRK